MDEHQHWSKGRVNVGKPRGPKKGSSFLHFFSSSTHLKFGVITHPAHSHTFHSPVVGMLENYLLPNTSPAQYFFELPHSRSRHLLGNKIVRTQICHSKSVALFLAQKSRGSDVVVRWQSQAAGGKPTKVLLLLGVESIGSMETMTDLSLLTKCQSRINVLHENATWTTYLPIL